MNPIVMCLIMQMLRGGRGGIDPLLMLVLAQVLKGQEK